MKRLRSRHILDSEPNHQVAALFRFEKKWFFEESDMCCAMEWDIDDVCAHPGRCQHIAIRRRAKSVYGMRQSTVGPVGGSLRYASRLTGTSRIRTQWSLSKDLPKHLRLTPQKAMERPGTVGRAQGVKGPNGHLTSSSGGALTSVSTLPLQLVKAKVLEVMA